MRVFVSFGIGVVSGGLASMTAPASETKRKNRKHSLEEQRPGGRAGRQPPHGGRAEAGNYSRLSQFAK